MGGGFHGIVKYTYGAKIGKNKSNIETNFNELTNYFKAINGKFGNKKGKNVREIECNNPLTDSAIFFNIIKQGYKK